MLLVTRGIEPQKAVEWDVVRQRQRLAVEDIEAPVVRGDQGFA